MAFYTLKIGAQIVREEPKWLFSYLGYLVVWIADF